MPWLAIAIGSVVALAAIYVLGALHGTVRAYRDWARHEIAHGRSWPPPPRPIPPPPTQPPTKPV